MHYETFPDIHARILEKKLENAKPSVLHELIQNQFLPIIESLDAKEVLSYLLRGRIITRHEWTRVKNQDDKERMVLRTYV